MLKLTLLFQLFSKFWGNTIWPIKAKSTISAKIFFRETLWGLCIKTDKSAYFWRRTTDFRKTFKWKKITSITKSREISRIFGHIWNILWLHLITDEKSIPWYCVITILPWHYANTMLLWKYYEYVSRNVFKTVKKATSKKDEIIKLHSDSLRFF